MGLTCDVTSADHISHSVVGENMGILVHSVIDHINYSYAHSRLYSVKKTCQTVLSEPVSHLLGRG